MKGSAFIGGDFHERGPSGERGRLRLSFERRDGKTVLRDWFATSPFGAVRANFPDGSGIPGAGSPTLLAASSAETSWRWRSPWLPAPARPC